MNTSRVAIDIDNVIAATDPLIRVLIERISGIRLSEDAIKEYAYSKALVRLGLEETAATEIAEEALRLFNESEGARAEIVAGSLQGVKRLVEEGFDLSYVTCRPHFSESFTGPWLANGGFPEAELLFVQAKADRANDWNFLVEDAAHHAEAVSRCGVHVCLLDYPWNRAIDEHPLIHRVSNWDEAVERIVQLSSRH